MLNAQMFLFNLEKEAQGILESGYNLPTTPQEAQQSGQYAATASKDGSSGGPADRPSTGPRSLADVFARIFG